MRGKSYRTTIERGLVYRLVHTNLQVQFFVHHLSDIRTSRLGEKFFETLLSRTITTNPPQESCLINRFVFRDYHTKLNSIRDNNSHKKDCHANRRLAHFPAKMGALKYVEELQKKKQSDLMSFLLRVRCWEVR